MYNEKGILWKSILEIQGIPLIVIPYRYGVLTSKGILPEFPFDTRNSLMKNQAGLYLY